MGADKAGLIKYLEELRARYPGLSARQMSLDAELADNAVWAILSGKTNPTPYTIKKLTDKWGTQEDYLAMMRLTGHLPPETKLPETNITDDELQAMNLLREAKGKEPIERTMVVAWLERQQAADDIEQLIAQVMERRPELDLVTLELAREKLGDDKLRALLWSVVSATRGSETEDAASAELHRRLTEVLSPLEVNLERLWWEIVRLFNELPEDARSELLKRFHDQLTGQERVGEINETTGPPLPPAG